MSAASNFISKDALADINYFRNPTAFGYHRRITEPSFAEFTYGARVFDADGRVYQLEPHPSSKQRPGQSYAFTLHGLLERPLMCWRWLILQECRLIDKGTQS